MLKRPGRAAAAAGRWLMLAALIAPGFAVNQFFNVTSSHRINLQGSIIAGSVACFTIHSGQCLTDGFNNYANGERCTVVIEQNIQIHVEVFSTEPTHDFISINGVHYSGSGGNLNGTIVSAGSVLTWFSDVNTVGVGFIICAVPPNTVFSCNFFARGFCGMSHDGRWALATNTGTLSVQTGPALGQLTEMDGFAFIEASGAGANFSNLSVSGLQLPLGGYALFWYHMYGRQTARLELVATAESGSGNSQHMSLWAAAGEQHNSSFDPWSRVIVAVPPMTVALTWIGEHRIGDTVGTSFRGDMSVDSIVVVPGPVPPLPAVPTPLFRVVSATPLMACWVTVDGDCFTDGLALPYDNNENCTIETLTELTLHVSTFDTEPNADRLTVLGQQYSGTTGPGGSVLPPNTLIHWTSDTSDIRTGFTICGIPRTTSFPTTPPTRVPTNVPLTLAPSIETPTGVPVSLVPTTEPTGAPTIAPTTDLSVPVPTVSQPPVGSVTTAAPVSVPPTTQSSEPTASQTFPTPTSTSPVLQLSTEPSSVPTRSPTTPSPPGIREVTEGGSGAGDSSAVVVGSVVGISCLLVLVVAALRVRKRDRVEESGRAIDEGAKQTETVPPQTLGMFLNPVHSSPTWNSPDRQKLALDEQLYVRNASESSKESVGAQSSTSQLPEYSATEADYALFQSTGADDVAGRSLVETAVSTSRSFGGTKQISVPMDSYMYVAAVARPVYASPPLTQSENPGSLVLQNPHSAV